MLSQKARYALRALLHLAGHEAPVAISTIAEREAISRKFLELILGELRNAGLVVSARGKKGGYRLSRSPGQISFAEVIRAIDGPLALAPCASRTAFHPCAGCPDPAICRIRPVLVAVRDATASILEGATLELQGEARELIG